jgi:hypothetical protein
MAKALLLNYLVEQLGEYVDNLTKDHLRMGVMDGVLEFHNLHLKPMALAKLNLPFRVHEQAKIKYLHIKIPWRNLGGGTPVELMVDGLFLQIDPLDFDKLRKDEIDSRAGALRTELLRQATSLAMESGLKSLFQEGEGGAGEDGAE